MFIGHFAPAFVAAAVSKKAPGLGFLFIGAQLLDWGFMTFGLMGIEKMRLTPGITVLNPLDLYHMPYTHSLVASMVWALVFSLIAAVIYRHREAALLSGFVVLSHFFLDWLVHAPDLTIAGESSKFGLGLWNLPWVEIPLELGILLLGFFYYTSRTRGPVAVPFILLALLLISQIITWTTPGMITSDTQLFISGIVSFTIFTLAAKWVGETRWHKNIVGLAVPSKGR